MKGFKLFSHDRNNHDSQTGRSMILPIVFCLVCGVLLILFGDLAPRITAYVLSGIMAICGVWSVIAYIRSAPARRITESRLATGLILLVAGILLAFNPDYLNASLSYIWGLALLFGGSLKIQYAFDEKSVNINRWWIMLILSAFSIIIGIFSLLNPAFLGESRNLVIGILLVLEALLDITVWFLLRHALKKHNHSVIPASPDVPETVPEEPAEKQTPETIPDTEA